MAEFCSFSQYVIIFHFTDICLLLADIASFPECFPWSASGSSHPSLLGWCWWVGIDKIKMVSDHFVKQWCHTYFNIWLKIKLDLSCWFFFFCLLQGFMSVLYSSIPNVQVLQSYVSLSVQLKVMLSMAALFYLRWKEPDLHRPVKVRSGNYEMVNRFGLMKA